MGCCSNLRQQLTNSPEDLRCYARRHTLTRNVRSVGGHGQYARRLPGGPVGSLAVVPVCVNAVCVYVGALCVGGINLSHIYNECVSREFCGAISSQTLAYVPLY